jgi:hypothetical protein
MARRRMLSPEMFTSRTVNDLPVEARWTWVGLLCYLDDYGYGEEQAALVKAAVWPLDESRTTGDVAGDMARLVEAGSLCRFICCNKAQMHAPNWREWQTVAHPGKPRLCVCPVHSRDAHETHRTASRETHERLALKEVNSSEKNLSGQIHELTDCLRPDLCHFHRQQDTA